MTILQGITVVTLEQAIAAPFATRQLADLGARVIKIERPGSGDFARGYDTTVRGLSSHFVWTNRGKESVTLNLKDPRALGILRELIQRADVFVQNLAPGAVDRLGLGAAELRAAKPSLIVCAISGYGSSGPYCERKAYDLLVQCETGLVSITGTPETPSKVGISIADIAAGMYGLVAILTALYNRQRTGEGASLEVSMFDALAEWMSYPAYFTLYGGEPPLRTGASHATIAPYGPFRTADGGVFLGVQNEREWSRFCASVIERPELASDSRFASNHARVAHRVELDERIGQALAGLRTQTVLDRLEAAQIANAMLKDIRGFVQHPQLEARGRWREIDSPVGRLRALLPPVVMAGQEPAMGPIPAIGQHTHAVLEEIGMEPGTVELLEQAGAL
jgi:itaconate CoA-transferase